MQKCLLLRGWHFSENELTESTVQKCLLLRVWHFSENEFTESTVQICLLLRGWHFSENEFTESTLQCRQCFFLYFLFIFLDYCVISRTKKCSDQKGDLITFANILIFPKYFANITKKYYHLIWSKKTDQNVLIIHVSWSTWSVSWSTSIFYRTDLNPVPFRSPFWSEQFFCSDHVLSLDQTWA